MAEAHSAVAFSFAVTHEGVDVNFDREVLMLVWHSGIRSWKKRMARFKNNVRSGVYPAPLHSLWATVGALAAVHFSGVVAVPYDIVERVVALLPGRSIPWQVAACTLSSLGVWLTFTFSIRYSLKLLFMYKGWMYESRAKGSRVSKATMAWLACVKLLTMGRKPMLYSYQGSLPKLPVPAVKDTMARYLRSVRPLVDDEQYTRLERLAAEFQNGIGKKLQRYLWLKSWWSTNYVSDWWEEYVYLRGRSALMVNSNFYGIDAIMIWPTKVQAARAAMTIHSCLLYRRAIERQELEPILVQNLVPLCSWQYERVFNTTRLPGLETDRIMHCNDAKHIAVYHAGRYFRVPIYHNRRLLRPCEIQIQMEKILEDASLPAKGEAHLAALTASERRKWAETRHAFFSRGINRASLDAVEKAAFVVCLDDIEYNYDPSDPSKLDQYGRSLLHGKGCDRWFDKSFTLCIGTNGRIGFNSEHSWADAAVMSHLWEFVLAEELDESRADAPVMGHLWEYCFGEELTSGYDEKGNCRGTPEFDPPTPTRLQWDLPAQCVETIEACFLGAQQLLGDVDLRIYVHDHYGKGFMKKCRVSPDAYIQMVLQLAYFRDAGRFNLTYEASMTRLYREGRTETVRPCSIESAAFVRAMEDNSVPREEKIRLMQVASARHQLAYQDAMCGKGIDRHLFCLYVVSKYLEVDSPFLKEVLSEPWRLSTSQTPHGQTSRLDLNKHPKCISAGGGFGPVADDGYGVSYIIAGEDLIFFHISSKKSSPDTVSIFQGLFQGLMDPIKSFADLDQDSCNNCLAGPDPPEFFQIQSLDSNRFARQIQRSLADIRNLYEGK